MKIQTWADHQEPAQRGQTAGLGNEARLLVRLQGTPKAGCGDLSAGWLLNSCHYILLYFQLFSSGHIL